MSDDDDYDNDVDDKLLSRQQRGASKGNKGNKSAANKDAAEDEFDERALRERANAARRRKRDFRIGDDENGDDGDVVEAAGVRAARVHRDAVTGKQVIDAVAGEQLPGLADDDDDDDEGNKDGKGAAYVIDGREVAIEPFHLERERRHGYFDEDGHYIEHGFGKEETEEDAAGMPVSKKAKKGRKKKKGDDDDDDDDDDDGDGGKASGSESGEANKDAWFTEVEEWGKEGGTGKMQAAAKAHAAHLARIAEAEAAPPADPEQSARAIVALLRNNSSAGDDEDDGETVRAAMQRLRPPKRDRKQPPPSEEQQREAKETLALLNQLTEHTSVLVNAGFPDVYDAGREEIENWVAQQRKAKRNAEAAAATGAGGAGGGAADDMVWHYRVSISAREIQGPFTTAQMKPWYEAGYFASPDVLVRVRHRNDERTGFQPADRVNWSKWFGGQSS
jgi:hypothetical protein